MYLGKWIYTLELKKGGIGMLLSNSIETFFAIEPKVAVLVLLNLLLWVSIGFLLYKLIGKKKK